MENTVEYDANEHKVDAVTVFQTNRAEIKRTIQVDLKDGQNDIDVKNLPSYLDEDSIRVDGIGNAVIFDVIYHAPRPFKKPEEIATQELHDEKGRLQGEISILEGQSDVLKKYCNTLSSSDTNAESLISFLEVFASRQRHINDTLSVLNKELQQIDKKLLDASNNVNAEQQGATRRGARVTIIVLAVGDGEAALSLTYVVSNAWWKPHYDLRASITQDSKSHSHVHLHYRASITQTTGEDWSDVLLTLSTASPLQGTSVPTLQPQWIARANLYKPAWGSVGEGGFKSAESTGSSLFGRVPPAANVMPQAPTVTFGSAQINVPGLPSIPPPGFFRGQDSTTTDGAVSTTFTIPGRSSIPSDSTSSMQTHKVSVAEIEFDSVELEWITVPKDIPSVFLRCKVQNTSKYPLLPGQANVFLNNSFVAKSNIPHVNPQENFTCSLGADPSVRVTYHPQTKKTKTIGTFGIGSKTTTKTFRQSFTIKNARSVTIQRLVVKDQIPVSRDADIKVNVLQPKELSGRATTTDLASVKKGVQTRWAQRNEDESSENEGRSASDFGLIEWICEISAGETLDLDLTWEIVAPAGVEWEKQ